MSGQPRLNIPRIAPDIYHHLLQMEQLVAAKLEPRLLHLLKLRASQINGCAYCIGMHTDEALRDGEPTNRLTLLDAWPESSLFTDKERAALQWIEELTLIADSGASGEAYEKLKIHFSEDETIWLTVAGALINTWNRLGIASRAEYSLPERAATRAEPATVE